MIGKFLFIVLTGLTLAVSAGVDKKNWCEDFDAKSERGILPAGWEIKATKWGVNVTSFRLESIVEAPEQALISGVLKIVADKATGALFFKLSKLVDLTKTPILRWRWRVNAFPKGGDGRESQRDDQAIAIYIGASDWMVKKSIAYRWETETPRGYEGNSSYAGGAIQVKWFCLRNRESGEGKWVIEERNIAEDFKKAFGFIPKDFVISVGANSQHTNSESLAYLDYVEFIHPGESKTLEVAISSEKK